MTEKIAGIMSAGAFLVVVIIGVYFRQPAEDVMLHALIAMVAFYLLGFVFGEVGSMVVLERMERFDLARWEATEGKRLEEMWQQDKQKVLEQVNAQKRGKPVSLVSVDAIQGGMVLAKSIHDESGKVVLKEGFRLTKDWARRLKERGIDLVHVYRAMKH